MSLRFKYFYKNRFVWQDSEFLRETRSHPDVIQNLFHSKKITTIEQEQWYNDVYSQDKDFKIWIAFDEINMNPIGYVQFHIDSIIHRRCEVGYVVHPNFQGYGYGKQMVRWSINHIKHWDDVEIHRLWLTVFSDNVKAMKLYYNNGFEIEGYFSDYVYKDGKYRDVYIMAQIL